MTAKNKAQHKKLPPPQTCSSSNSSACSSAPETELAELRREYQALQQRLLLLEQALNATSNGIVITDPNQADNPIIYANQGFERITGYQLNEVLGRNCRFLQGQEQDQEALQILRKQLSQSYPDNHHSLKLELELEQESGPGANTLNQNSQHRVVLRNYRKDGSLFYNELFISPVYDQQGQLTNFIGVQNDLTKQYQSQRQLEQNERRFRALVEKSSEVVAIHDREGRYLYVSPAIEAILGYDHRQLVGQLARDLIHPDDLTAVREVLVQLYTQPGRTVKVPLYRARHANGEWRYFETIVTNLLDNQEIGGCVAHGYDVTERELARQARQESEARFEAFMEHSPVAAWIVEETGRMLYVNRAYCQMFNTSPQMVVGKQVSELYPPAFAQTYLERVQRVVSSGQTEEISDKWARPDGSEGYYIGYRFPLPSVRNSLTTALALDSTLPPKLMGGVALDVSEPKRVEAELLKSQKLYQTLVNHFPNGAVFLFDHELRFTLADGEGLSKVGMSPEQLVGRTLAEVLPPAKAAELEPYYQAALAGNYLTFETGFGENQTDLVQALPIKDEHGQVVAGMMMTQNITQRKQAEAALAAEKERLAVTLESIGEAVLWLDLDGRIVELNPAAEALTGYQTIEIIGKPIAQILRVKTALNQPANQDYLAITQIPLRKVGIGKSQGTEMQLELENNTELLRQDGSLRRIAGKVSFMREGHTGRVSGIVVVLRDITEQVQRETELLRIEKLESLGILAGGIAHDFNNILTAIVGNLGLARLELLNGEQTSFLQTGRPPADQGQLLNLLAEAESAAYRAKTLTQQLITFAKGSPSQKRALVLGPLLEETTRFVLRGSKVRPAFEIAEGLWPVEADEGQIGQVLHNLVLNAQQAMPGGGWLRVRAENVRGSELEPSLVLSPTRDYLKISFEDQGSGISEEYHSRIFDPYFTTKQKGSGLGLAAAFSIIQQHGGTITLRSKVGEGSTFYLYLPASSEHIFNSQTQTRTEVEAETSSNPGWLAPKPELWGLDEVRIVADKTITGRPKEEGEEKKKESESFDKGSVKLPGYKGRILVMDDEAGLRTVVRKVLERAGYEVTLAQDGAEALVLYHQAQQSGKAYDLVIMDLTIPGGMGGKEAISHLLALDPKVKAVVASGYSVDPVLDHYQDYGFVGTLKKPFQVEELLRKLKELLQPKQEG